MISKYVKDEVIFKNNNYNIIITFNNRLELFFAKNWHTNMNEDLCPSKSNASAQCKSKTARKCLLNTYRAYQRNCP